MVAGAAYASFSSTASVTAAVELEPPFEHVAFAEKVTRLDPTRILQILHC